MRFTSQFVAFTSICTIIAIVLPPPADAAYIASHPSGNRIATAHEADKPRTIFSLPRLTTGHGPHELSEDKGKSIIDTPNSRFFRFSDSDPLNPLAGILDHSFAHVHGDDVHPPFLLRDASSRRPTPLSRRSSALVHGADGNNYLVSRGAASKRPLKRRLGRRGISDPVSGIIDIVSGDQGRHLASLALDSSMYNSTNTTSTNSTSSHASNGSIPLNASSTNGTQFYLVDANDSSFNDPANTTKHVMVQTDIFDSLYCATFDPNPSGPEPMIMEMCRPSQSENDVKNLDYSYANGVAPIVDYTLLAADSHKSQIFEYNPSTGVIKPLWTNSEGSTSSHAMFVERDTTTSFPTGSNTMSSAGSTTSSTSAPQPTNSSIAPEAQNVTLVFRPSNAAVSAPLPSTNAADSSTDDVATTTITTTVVYTTTAIPSSYSSSASEGPIAAVAALSMTPSSSSSIPACSSTSTSTPSPAVHAAAAASSTGSSSSQATSMGSTPIQVTSSSIPPSPSVHAAIVASSPGSSSSQATSPNSATSTQSTSSSMPPSPSVHAAIVASVSGSSSSQAVPMSSVTTSQATSPSQPVRGSLEIEFVPIAVSSPSASITSSSPSSSLSSSSPTSSSSPSSSSATPSQLNAAAIASAIANFRSSASAASTTNTGSSSVSTTVAPATTTK
ncbi:uncharacterized protein EDB93DRAFT_569679 [Suillus bovinus]|uniref:uncharacterized protein n=1 Tax=Suillus bovinus TaxID=48563 RepID=UPI001B86EEF5|nr:uncharacterized protein EDB93DRAFT_569679 [Suillus bovinus]KAG2143802.1 hypothetical protein EDB93DRAFT_569679 [Suillus bovinus]